MSTFVHVDTRWHCLTRAGLPARLGHGTCACSIRCARKLAPEFPSWALDLPGHGRSAWHADRAGFEAQTSDLLAALPPRCTLLAWSLGAQFALEIARRAPERVAALVLIAASPRFERAADWPWGLEHDAVELFRETLAQDWRHTLEDFIWLQLRGSRHAESAVEQIHRALHDQGPPDKQALAAGLELLGVLDTRDRVAAVSQPVLLIAGQNDRVTPPGAGRWLADQLPQGQYREIARAGHAPFLSHVEETAAVIREFLRAPGRRLAIRAVVMTTESADDPYRLEPTRVARSFSAASDRYDAFARLQAEVRTELLSRVAALREPPRAILDLGCGTGAGAESLKRQFRKARVVAADLAPGMVDGRAPAQATGGGPCSAKWPMPTSCRSSRRSSTWCSLNLMLQWAEPLDPVLAGIRRVLKPGGLLLASSFGPETLRELRWAFESADDAVHVNRFIDMHDLGSALQRAGFSEPVLDTDRHPLWYPDTRALMGELKGIGAHNLNAGRARGLTGRKSLARMVAAYESLREPRGLPATWQVVFMTAWAPLSSQGPGGVRMAPESTIDVAQLRAGLRRR